MRTIIVAVTVIMGLTTLPAIAASNDFGPNNPFYAPSTLPFRAPDFSKIKDADYQPAIEAGMAEQIKEVEAIANNPEPPTFENTIVALEKSGQLLDRVVRSLLRRRRREQRSRTAEGSLDRGAEARGARGCDPPQHEAVRARQGRVRPAPVAASRSRGAAPGRVGLPAVHPCGRQPQRGGQDGAEEAERADRRRCRKNFRTSCWPRPRPALT